MASFRFRAAMIALCSLLGARELCAAPTPADRALATELFNQGRNELSRGDLASACPKLEESQRLDPGPGTLLNVAKCHEQQGRTASAWTEYSEALAIAEREGQTERVTFAAERIAALEPKLSRVVVRVPPESDQPELVVMRDGTPIARAAWGTAMPIDPGRHVVSATATGRRPWQVEIEVGADADRDEVSVPALEVLPLEPVIFPPPPNPPAPQLFRILPPVAPVDRRVPPGKIAGWTVAGAGFAALAGATVAGVVTFVKDDASDARCAPTCDDEGYALNQAAKLSADVSTALFIVGGVAAGVGVTVVLLTPDRAPQVSLLPGVSGGTLRVSF